MLSLCEAIPRLLLLSAALLAAAAPLPGSAARTGPEPDLRAALDRAVAWLEAHPAGTADRAAERAMDVWTWCLLGWWHPDAEIRSRAAEVVRSRLGEGIPPVVGPTDLSYQAPLLRCREAYGLLREEHRRQLASRPLDRILEASAPTTRWWSGQFLVRSGLPVETDPTDTGLARIARELAEDPEREPTLRDAFVIFHELVPASDLGREPVRGLGEPELSAARTVLPGAVALAMKEANSDALAEALVAAEILGLEGEPWFREGLAWLAGHQREDGTFPRARGPAEPPLSNLRHGVLVGTFALLRALQ